MRFLSLNPPGVHKVVRLIGSCFMLGDGGELREQGEENKKKIKKHNINVKFSSPAGHID